MLKHSYSNHILIINVLSIFSDFVKHLFLFCTAPQNRDTLFWLFINIHCYYIICYKAFYLTTQQRRYIAMCRDGVLPIEIEKGRWRNEPRKQRICKQCDSVQVEDIQHFILHCTRHRNLRATYLTPNESLKNILTYRICLKNVSI